jgi:hypothetical protein
VFASGVRCHWRCQRAVAHGHATRRRSIRGRGTLDQQDPPRTTSLQEHSCCLTASRDIS